MYSVDANLFMNAVVVAVLGTGAVFLLATLLVSTLRPGWRRGLSYLYMLTALFACFGVAVAIDSVVGQTIANAMSVTTMVAANRRRRTEGTEVPIKA